MVKTKLGQKVLLGALAVLSGAGGLGAFASTASATQDPVSPTNASVEVCKASVTGLLAVTGSFTFHVTGAAGNGNVSVAAGTCSAPIPVTGTTSVVTEASDPSYSVTAIAVPPGGVIPGTNTSYLTASSLSGQSATLALATNLTDTVTFTDTINPGWVEICKNAAATSGLTGTFAFKVAGAEGWLNGGPASANLPNINVAVGSCSAPLEMPAGSVISTEAGTNLYVTSLTANYGGTTTSALVGSPNLITGTATALVRPFGDPSTQTDINYTDNVVAFKVCKVWDPSAGPQPSATQLYPFTFAVSGAAGPVTAPPSVSLAAGTCSPVTTFRAGTAITVTEGIVPGTKVESIVDTDAKNGSVAESILNTGTVTAPVLATNVVTRSVTYVLGTPVTATQTVPGNEVAATFTDVDAAPGTLKVCKYAGTNAAGTVVQPVGTTFNYTYTGTAYATVASTGVAVGQVVPVSGSFSVQLGQCTIVSENPVLSTGGLTPVPFLYNSNVSLTEVPSAGNAVSSISAASSFVSVLGTSLTNGVGTMPFLTAEPVVSSINTAAGTSVATIGETTVSEIDYFNIDPPFVTVTPDPVVTGGSPVVVSTPTITSSGVSTVANGNSSSGNSVAPVVAPAVAPTTPALSVTKVVAPLTKAQKAALLKKDERSLSNVKAAITRENKLLKGHLTTAARKADVKRLSQLKSEMNLLNREIRSL